MIGGYERVGVVARGAHSTIWKGFDPGLKREVALKQLSGSGAGEAARREAAALAGLRHPNILSVYDVLEDAEGVWLIEQWITGAPLSAVLAVTGKLRAIDALALVHGALHGLSYAHGRDVIHGDITPANILIDQSGTPMLVDFGLAVSPGHLSLGGTPGYMAPEAAAGQPVDKRSDVYSSCVVLAELLKGARLFTTASSLALTREQATAAPQLGGIEAPVAAVLSTGLHPRPDDRPTDAETLLTRLEAAIEETHGRRWLAAAGLGAIGSTAATVAAGTTLTGTASAATTTGAGAAAAKPGTIILTRGKVIGVAAATAAAVIALVIALILLRPEPPHPTAAQTTTPPPAAGAAPLAQPTFSGTYLFHYLSSVCSGRTTTPWPDGPLTITQQGNTIHIGVGGPGGINGPLNADGSFVATGTFPDQGYSYTATWRGVFATEGGRTVIRDGEWTEDGSAMGPGGYCHDTFTATKQ
ncbi:protein kinase [Mycobacterium numidiamassiliense]|uniref:Protein kinase n=1 Tax=Mycobacterium numidiamassiliense TaxID=1841861 RepID=A0A2U3P9U3_9MYCO|nr:serine/threonine-protein kinase [Mycobacterium numidiamassiliense]SPM40528.1 protein kinase [Mycobacterium numidiamassiliense]